MTHDKNAVRKILAEARAAKRAALTAPEARGVCEAYGITIPKEGVANSAEDAAKLASDIGFPVVMKIVSPQILHKTEAGGVMVGVKSAAAAKDAYATIVGQCQRSTTPRRRFSACKFSRCWPAARKSSSAR